MHVDAYFVKKKHVARNLGYARTDDTANKTKNNTWNYRDFIMNSDLKFR